MPTAIYEQTPIQLPLCTAPFNNLVDVLQIADSHCRVYLAVLGIDARNEMFVTSDLPTGMPTSSSPTGSVSAHNERELAMQVLLRQAIFTGR